MNVISTFGNELASAFVCVRVPACSCLCVGVGGRHKKSEGKKEIQNG